MQSIEWNLNVFVSQQIITHTINSRNVWLSGFCLTLIMLTWKIGWAPNNASKWQMGFNSAFKGLKWIIFVSSVPSVGLHTSCINCSTNFRCQQSAGEFIFIEVGSLTFKIEVAGIPEPEYICWHKKIRKPFVCGCGFCIDGDHCCYFFSPTSKEVEVRKLQEPYYLRKQKNTFCRFSRSVVY